MSDFVVHMTKEDLDRYLGMIEKTSIIHRAELSKNPFDLNAHSNLIKLDNMAVQAMARYYSRLTNEELINEHERLLASINQEWNSEMPWVRV